jgi:hypothetical protein
VWNVDGTAIGKIYSPIIYGTFLADLPIERAGIQHTYTENSTKGLSSMSIVILHYTNRQILIILMGKGLVSLMITIVYGSILRPSSNNWASYRRLKWQIAALFL